VQYGLRLKKEFSISRVIQPDGSTAIDEIHAWFDITLKRGATNKTVEWHANIVASRLMTGTCIICVYVYKLYSYIHMVV
jgi:hypothetical protein